MAITFPKRGFPVSHTLSIYQQWGGGVEREGYTWKGVLPEIEEKRVACLDGLEEME